MIDFGLLLDNIILQLWWLLPLVLLLVLFRSAWFRDKTGETMINLTARLCLDKKVYHRIKNISLPTEDGGTRIDHIIVSRYGLFVVEINNMKGMISSGEYQETWTQEISGSTHKFDNPLRQTEMKATTLQLWLGLESNKVLSITVFAGDCIFTSPMPDNVIHNGGYIRYIKSKTELLLSKAEIQQIIYRITEGKLTTSNRPDKQHANHAHSCIESIQAIVKESAKTCPDCGSTMILHAIRHGSEAGHHFWGCSTYPKCRMVVKVNKRGL